MLWRHKANNNFDVEVLFNGDIGWDLAKNAILLIVAISAYGYLLFLTRQTIIVASRYIEFDMRNELYAHFDAFKNKKIIWCDAQTSSYFEDSPLEPDIVLADLIHCFHPDLLPNYKPKYYKLLK